jgi:hypothetical protein
LKHDDYLFNITQFVAFGVKSFVPELNCETTVIYPFANDVDIHLKRREIILYADDTAFIQSTLVIKLPLKHSVFFIVHKTC